MFTSRSLQVRRIVKLKRNLSLYSLFFPFGIVLFIFSYLPIYGVLISFKEYSPYTGFWANSWVGLKHFKYFLTDDKFWLVIENTIILNCYDFLFGFTAPIIFALLIKEVYQMKLKKMYQVISYLPHFLSWVVIAGIVILILSPSEGLINRAIQSFGFEPIHFLIESGYFRPAVVITEMWKNVGYSAILYYATIAGISPHLYEAAYIDGASRWKMVWHVTLPGMMPMIVLLLLLKISGLFTIGFERIFLLQNALNYNVSEVISTYIYRIGFVSSQYSLSTAIGLVQSIMGFLLLITANRLAKRISGMGMY